MYANGKMRPAETILGIGAEGIRGMMEGEL
jgi:hypothetical protein